MMFETSSPQVNRAVQTYFLFTSYADVKAVNSADKQKYEKRIRELEEQNEASQDEVARLQQDNLRYRVQIKRLSDENSRQK